MNINLIDNEKNILNTSQTSQGVGAATEQSIRHTIPRVEETLMMNQICDVYTKKEGFWVEKRSDISQYFLYIDILRQYNKQLESIEQSHALLTEEQQKHLDNFSLLQVVYPDNFYEKIYSFLKIQVDLCRCNNMTFGRWGIWIFVVVQIVKLSIYTIPIILIWYVDFYYILVYQLITLASLCYILLIVCNLLIAFLSRIESIQKMKLNDQVIQYENSYKQFIFNDRLTHSFSDGLSWFFILKSTKVEFMHKLWCCSFELNSEFIEQMNTKYSSLNDDDLIITIIFNAKWKVKNTKAYKSLNDILFNSLFIYEIIISLLFSISYGYYLIDDFDLV